CDLRILDPRTGQIRDVRHGPRPKVPHRVALAIGGKTLAFQRADVPDRIGFVDVLGSEGTRVVHVPATTLLTQPGPLLDGSFFTRPGAAQILTRRDGRTGESRRDYQGFGSEFSVLHDGRQLCSWVFRHGAGNFLVAQDLSERVPSYSTVNS